MVHLFEPPIRLSGQDTTSIGGKRKRDEAAFDSDASDQPDANNPAHRSPPSQAVGDDSQTDTPFDFPHAPLEAPSKGRLITKQRNRKQQHFHVLNAMLHRSLLDHDYERARKAFALLLRFEIGGRRADLRHKGLWGIGAEVLLRRKGSQMAQPLTANDVRDDDIDAEAHPVQHDVPFSQEGFDAARAYYQRLILQYPPRKTHPHSVNAQTFYPAMFTLWIFQVQNKYETVRRRVHREVSSPTSDVSGSAAHHLQSDETRRKSTADDRHIANRELEEAREILTALSELTLSPPYDRDARLLLLEGRLQFWIRDLVQDSNVNGHSDSSEHDLEARRLFSKAQAHGATLFKDEVRLLEDRDNSESMSEV